LTKSTHNKAKESGKFQNRIRRHNSKATERIRDKPGADARALVTGQTIDACGLTFEILILTCNVRTCHNEGPEQKEPIHSGNAENKT
jgi:hypothetical protein